MSRIVLAVALLVLGALSISSRTSLSSALADLPTVRSNSTPNNAVALLNRGAVYAQHERTRTMRSPTLIAPSSYIAAHAARALQRGKP